MCWSAAIGSSQFAFEAIDIDDPAIGYHSSERGDAGALLNQRIQSGTQQLQFDGAAGYLRSLLAALEIPVESQIVVYSKTSLQSARISPQNPRTIFFNDTTAVAWVPGGFIEVAAHDARQGAVFYTLNQAPTPVPQLMPDGRCLSCHLSTAAEGVPGFFVRSIPTAIGGETLPWLGNFITDHRSALHERWGGWYVTANEAPDRHLGNALLAGANAQELPPWSTDRSLTTLKGRLDAGPYLSPYSDVVALLVFEHQARMMNLLTRVGWQARILSRRSTLVSSAWLQPEVNEAADYMLFVDEAELTGVVGSSGFAATFSALGIRDRMGRSLRDLDLRRRLMRYPLSYMIYSNVFDALPTEAKAAIYGRLWAVLSGQDRSPKYSRISDDDRRAIREILRDTKRDLPAYFLGPD
jgi:hypothetical protein